MTIAEKRRRLLVLGASGHGKIVGACASAMDRWSEILFFDDRWPERKELASWSVAGSTGSLLNLAGNRDDVFVAIGNAQVRIPLLLQLRNNGLSLATLIHPGSIVDSNAVLGAGTIVVAGAIINIDVSVGLGGIINTGSTVDHDCVLGEGVHVCPGANLAGNVSVGDRSWIGIGSAVKQGVKIGRNVTVGAGAVVVNDLSDDRTYAGVPARPLIRDRDA